MVSPYEPEQINPASVDLRIGNEFIELRSGSHFKQDTLQLSFGDAVLATTVEHVAIPSGYAAMLLLKSSRAREGLDHALAGWIDPGFEGQLTMELHAHRDVMVQAGQRVVQMVLHRMVAAPERPYQGRYQGQIGPTESRASTINDMIYALVDGNIAKEDITAYVIINWLKSLRNQSQDVEKLKHSLEGETLKVFSWYQTKKMLYPLAGLGN